MAEVITKVVKVPVRILEDNKDLRLIKYRALDEVMREARYLGNLAIRYAIAYRLEGIPKETDESGKAIALDTKIYRILTAKRKYLDSGTVATLGRNFAAKMLKNSDRDAWAGRKSLPTYKALFIPFRHTGTKFQEIDIEGTRQFSITPPWGKKWLSDELIVAAKGSMVVSDEQRPLTLVSTFSWKDKGAADIVRRIISEGYSLSDSQIKRKDRDIMMFLTYKLKVEQPVLDPEKVCGVDLGVVIPAVCAVNSGPQRMSLGNGGDVWAARSKFRAERRRKQGRLGLYSKTRKWDRSEKEDRWIHTYYHTLTRQVIKFCLQQGCGKIHMEDLEQLRQSELENEYKRLVWVPSKFNSLLQYKADEVGIDVIKINPRNTSRRCSDCGHIAKENRKDQASFLCVKCGSKANADYNAAKNIALASGEVIKNGYVVEE